MPHFGKFLPAGMAAVCIGLIGCGSTATRQAYVPSSTDSGTHAQAVTAEKPQRVAYACEYKWLTAVHLKRLGRKDPQERSLAALALGGLFDPDTIEPLIEALQDKEADVRTSAQLALRSLTGQDFPKEDYAAWREWWKANKRFLPDAAFVERKKSYMKTLNANTVTLESLSRESGKTEALAPDVDP